MSNNIIKSIIQNYFPVFQNIPNERIVVSFNESSSVTLIHWILLGCNDTGESYLKMC